MKTLRFSLALLLLFPAFLQAQEETASLPAPEETIALQAEIEDRLQTRKASLESADESNVGARWLREEVDLLESFATLLEEQASIHEESLVLIEEKENAEQERSLEETIGVDHPPPFALREFDPLLERLELERKRRDSLTNTLEAEEAVLEDAREQAKEAERAHRDFIAQLEEADAAEAVELRHQVALAELRARRARQKARTIELRLVNGRLESEIAAMRTQRLEEAAAWMRSRVQPDAEELQKRKAEFDEEERRLEAQLREARVDLEHSEAQWQTARRKLTEAAEPSAELQVEVDARRSELTLTRRRVEMGEQSLRLSPLRRSAWELRFRFLRGENLGYERIEEANEELEITRRELERAEQQVRSFLGQAEVEAADTAAVLTSQKEPSVLRPARRRLAAAQKTAETARAALNRLEISRVEVDRALDLAEERSRDLDWRERARRLQASVQEFWDWEIFVVQDNSITLGKIVLAVLLILLGFFASRRISSFFGKRILSRFDFDEGVSATVQTLTFYGLLLIFVFWAFNIVNIPLTVFTFLGGALAIGVGFGSQNIVNNFMSGLILMIERPIKVGDLIDLSGSAGRVEDIGPRSTRIHLGDNTHVIVPNSALLENTVLNWTHANHLVRYYVDVGVAYGSDTDLVVRSLQEALEEAKRALDRPAPEILFMNFGDSSLDFRVLFWTRIGAPMDLKRAASELRFLIDRRFREAEIEIPFPQRDVHLDLTSGSIPVSSPSVAEHSRDQLGKENDQQEP